MGNVIVSAIVIGVVLLAVRTLRGERSDPCASCGSCGKTQSEKPCRRKMR